MNKIYKPESLAKIKRALYVAAFITFLPALIFAQGKNEFRGVVVDQNSQSLPGVNIIQQGTNSGTVTGLDGSFVLSAEGSEITVSACMVGYSTIEFSLKVGETKTVVLEEDVVSL